MTLNVLLPYFVVNHYFDKSGIFLLPIPEVAPFQIRRDWYVSESEITFILRTTRSLLLIEN